MELDGVGVAYRMRGTAQDITEQRVAEEALEHQALHEIDKSLVAGLDDDTNDVAIVTAILSLASALDLTTIAEGVESASEASILGRLGRNMVQGYHFLRPVVATEVEHLLGDIGH